MTSNKLLIVSLILQFSILAMLLKQFESKQFIIKVLFTALYLGLFLGGVVLAFYFITQIFA